MHRCLSSSSTFQGPDLSPPPIQAARENRVRNKIGCGIAFPRRREIGVCAKKNRVRNEIGCGTGIQINLRPDNKIRYKIDPHDKWKYVKIIENGGKETGKYNNWSNVKYGCNMFSVTLDSLSFFKTPSGSSSNVFNDENDFRTECPTVGSPICYSGITKIYESTS